MIYYIYSSVDLYKRVFLVSVLSIITIDSDFFASQAILVVCNTDLSAFNVPLLEQMPGKLYTLYSVDQAVIDNVDKGYKEFTYEFLQLIKLSGLPLSIL